jgi:hypothetical protein
MLSIIQQCIVLAAVPAVASCDCSLVVAAALDVAAAAGAGAAAAAGEGRVGRATAAAGEGVTGVNRGGLGEPPASGIVVGNCVAVAPFAAALAGVGFWPDEHAAAASSNTQDKRYVEAFIPAVRCSDRNALMKYATWEFRSVCVECRDERF